MGFVAEVPGACTFPILKMSFYNISNQIVGELAIFSTTLQEVFFQKLICYKRKLLLQTSHLSFAL